jgi:hypothetical protein
LQVSNGVVDRADSFVADIFNERWLVQDFQDCGGIFFDEVSQP